MQVNYTQVMPIVVVGGHSRNVGKTSVVAGLIAALRDFNWTAVKITQFGHGICAANGKNCACALDEHCWAIEEETDRCGKTDTSRFLLAGAGRALWVRTKMGELAEAMPSLRAAIADSESVIIESNSVLRFLRPSLYLTVLDSRIKDFKASAREYFASADAVLKVQSADTLEPHWHEVATEPGARPVFAISRPTYLTDEVVEFVRTGIGA
jgi:molybdopterin-guanine dinucleotide biosynthesis protein